MSGRDRSASRGSNADRGDRRGDQRNNEESMEHRIWIGGLPKSIRDEDIERLCSRYGPVLQVAIKQSARDTFAFATFGEASHASDAISALDQSKHFARGVIKVASAMTKGSRPPRKDQNYGGGDRGGGNRDGAGYGGGYNGGGGRYADQGRDNRDRDRDYRRDNYRDGRDDRRDRRPPARSPSRERQRFRSPDMRRYPDRQRSPRRYSPTPPSNRRSPVKSRDHRQQSRSRSRPRTSRYRVYLSQLPLDMEEDELEEIGNEWGKCLSLELHREGTYKCGSIEYAAEREATKAVKELNDRRMDKWSMRLQAYCYPSTGA